MNKEFAKMQKIAGLITESEYKEKTYENQSSGKSYEDLLKIVKQYEGFEDYVGSFKKAFQGKDTITKDAWMEWSRTLDGGYDQEGFAEKHWGMAGKGKMSENQQDEDEYPRLDQETYMEFLNACFECFDNGANAYDDSTWTDDERDLAQNLANVIGRAGIDIS
jgi:hypothetical protein